MRLTPRAALAFCVAAAFGLALAPWWSLSWQGSIGSGAAEVGGAAGTGGLAQVLAVAAAGGLLLTLTLRAPGRRIVGGLLALLFAGMTAVGVAAHGADAGVLAASVPEAALATDAAARASVWPTLYAAVGALGVAGSAWLVARPMVVRRGPAGEAPGVGLADSQASWKAMDAGIDPTQDGSGQEQS
ncbi:MAG: Trp biosynthesis-associated membrane protein [Propionibacteriaceae bacterium]|nr:Trp biosynthesis-associated membrane protein [Propionibacteriaceae bacterium]